MSTLGNLRGLVLMASLVVGAGFAGDVVASTVSGRVLYKSNAKPIPGLSVYVVHPTAGRSRPGVTDGQGQFAIPNVPPRADAYYLEIYWGKELKYRKSIKVSDPQLSVGNIAL
jgi:hypothetical protein